jgi:phytoene synthase
MNLSPDLEKSFEAARLLTRHHAKSFYFSSHFLNKTKRQYAYAIYSFCRYGDDLIDFAGSESKVDAVIKQLYEELNIIYSQHIDDSFIKSKPWAPAFLHTIGKNKIPQWYFEKLIEGFIIDRSSVRLKNFEQLYDYCFKVAGVVGLMMTRIFSPDDFENEKEAEALGIAMQLTNILRDIKEDWERDRIYLPEDELAQFGLSVEDIKKGENSDQWKAFMKFQIQRARDYYTLSEKGIVKLPKDGSQQTVWVMRSVYSKILDEIESVDYDVFKGRVYVPTWKKTWTALNCFLK